MEKQSGRLHRTDGSSGRIVLPDGREGRLLQSGGNTGQAIIDGQPGTVNVRRNKASGRLMVLGKERVELEEV